LNGFGLKFRIGFGDGDRFHGGPRNGVGREPVHRHEAPGALRDHPDARAITLRTGDAEHAVFAGIDKLVQIPADADVGVARTGPGRRVQGGVGQGLFGGGRQRLARG
jgi:hypothetical protein